MIPMTHEKAIETANGFPEIINKYFILDDINLVPIIGADIDIVVEALETGNEWFIALAIQRLLSVKMEERKDGSKGYAYDELVAHIGVEKRY